MVNAWSGADPTEASDSNSYELGAELLTNQNATISGIRVWAGASPGVFVTRKGHIWKNDGTLLATANMTDTLSAGWTTFNLNSPLPVTPGLKFVVTFETGGNYGVENHAFDNSVNSTDGVFTFLSAATGEHGNGAFTQTPGTLPDHASPQNTFYGVDIVYTTSGNTPPVIDSVGLSSAGATVTVTVNAHDAETLIGASYQFDFGDETIVSQAGNVLSHTYTVSGIYAIQVAVTDSGGLSDFESVPIVVRAGTLSDSLVKFTQFLHDLVQTNMVTLGVQAVFFGDQTKIAVTPTVCVESDHKTRTINGQPRRTDNQLSAFILVYHSKVQDTQITRKEADVLAEAIETLVHQDARMGGLVIHSLVTEIQSGLSDRAQQMFRSSRLTVQGLSQSQLPLAQ